MDNNELINRRVKSAEQHVRHIEQLLEEISLLAPARSFLDDMTNNALRDVALLLYHFGVMDNLTEKIEA